MEPQATLQILVPATRTRFHTPFNTVLCVSGGVSSSWLTPVRNRTPGETRSKGGAYRRSLFCSSDTLITAFTTSLTRPKPLFIGLLPLDRCASGTSSSRIVRTRVIVNFPFLFLVFFQFAHILLLGLGEGLHFQKCAAD